MTTTNLFEQPNLFEMKEAQDKLEQDKVLAVRILRQMWFHEGIDQGLTFGEYVESIITPEDVEAGKLFDEAMEKAQREEEKRQREEANQVAEHVKAVAGKLHIQPQLVAELLLAGKEVNEKKEEEAHTSPIQEGAKSLLRLQAIQNGCMLLF